ncbi:hypothetical protein EYS14_06305 [Alteromonadaceae bacterium M269]|nr:hypothetical protein EYS14_06305 [Alteromonadaceae bacterium M269]
MADQTGFYFQNYTEWRHALTTRCKISLTPEYARLRISALNDSSDLTTRDFRAKYGEAYLQQVIAWFQQAEREG